MLSEVLNACSQGASDLVGVVVWDCYGDASVRCLMKWPNLWGWHQSAESGGAIIV